MDETTVGSNTLAECLREYLRDYIHGDKRKSGYRDAIEAVMVAFKKINPHFNREDFYRRIYK